MQPHHPAHLGEHLLPLPRAAAAGAIAASAFMPPGASRTCQCRRQDRGGMSGGAGGKGCSVLGVDTWPHGSAQHHCTASRKPRLPRARALRLDAPRRRDTPNLPPCNPDPPPPLLHPSPPCSPFTLPTLVSTCSPSQEPQRAGAIAASALVPPVRHVPVSVEGRTEGG